MASDEPWSSLFTLQTGLILITTFLVARFFWIRRKVRACVCVCVMLCVSKKLLHMSLRTLLSVDDVTLFCLIWFALCVFVCKRVCVFFECPFSLTSFTPQVRRALV